MQLCIILTVAVSLSLCLIGVSTQYWYQSLSNEYHEGLWVSCRHQITNSYSELRTEICHKQSYMKSQGLAVSALVFLSIALVLTIIRRYKSNDIRLIYLTLVILTTSILLLIFSYLLYPRKLNLGQLGYSIYFMLFSSLLTFIATVLVALTVRKTRTTSTLEI